MRSLAIMVGIGLVSCLAACSDDTVPVPDKGMSVDKGTGDQGRTGDKAMTGDRATADKGTSDIGTTADKASAGDSPKTGDLAKLADFGSNLKCSGIYACMKACAAKCTPTSWPTCSQACSTGCQALGCASAKPPWTSVIQCALDPMTCATKCSSPTLFGSTNCETCLLGSFCNNPFTPCMSQSC